MAKQEQIYQIPVNDAFGQKEHCPLCVLRKELEDNFIDFYLGPSLMEADHRLVTNKKGFCHKHLLKLYDSQKNRLGLGLMLHTHLLDLGPDVEKILETSTPKDEKRKLFSKETDWKTNLQKAAQQIAGRAQSCTICDRIEETMNRYCEVIFYQYVHDEDFRKTLQTGQGFCLDHLAYLVEGASLYLKRDQAKLFMEDLYRIHKPILDTLAGDVEWFTLKFDYRNQDAPWENAKDALPRAIHRISGDDLYE